MNMSVKFPENSKSKHLSAEQIAELGQKIDAIRRDIMDSIGEQDAKYIYKIRDFVRYSEIASRGMLMFGGWIPPVWLMGTGLLGLSKIVENMELGHNVMHGQFDWLNDPNLNGANYDWDTMATGDDWKYTHNYIHHTYTNIVGKDHVRAIVSGDDGASFKAMAFRQGESVLGQQLLHGDRSQKYLLAGRAKIDDWGATPKAELHIDDLALAG